MRGAPNHIHALHCWASHNHSSQSAFLCGIRGQDLRVNALALRILALATANRVPPLIFPLAPPHVTWYKQFRREHLCGCVRRFLATLAACLASKFQKAVIDPGHGIRIRGQSSSKGFERTSKRSFLKFERFRLGLCRSTLVHSIAEAASRCV